jgi:hydrogenase maturation protease
MVIGIGTPYRSDDAAGSKVAHCLGAAPFPGVEVVEYRGDILGLVACWDGADRVYVVDAMCSGVPAGSVRYLDRFSLARAGRATSSHTVDVGAAVALAAALERLPSELVIIGIEAAETGFGDSLSPAVEAAVRAVTRHLRRELRAPTCWVEGPCRASEESRGVARIRTGMSAGRSALPEGRHGGRPWDGDKKDVPTPEGTVTCEPLKAYADPQSVSGPSERSATRRR